MREFIATRFKRDKFLFEISLIERCEFRSLFTILIYKTGTTEFFSLQEERYTVVEVKPLVKQVFIHFFLCVLAAKKPAMEKKR